jgi:hypothetical protein
MKNLGLSEAGSHTLREMGVFDPHPWARMRAQGMLRLSHGIIAVEAADEFVCT